MKNDVIITISRQFASGGRNPSPKSSRRGLDLPYYDNELITLAAKESGYNEEF